jgi:Mrp family chromosome partitioning ATPase/capsular polysaccharide biosynthesis protein
VNEATRYASLRDYLRVLRSNWWVILLIALVAGAAAYAMAAREAKSYESTATVSFTAELAELGVIGDGLEGGQVTPPDENSQARAQSVDRIDMVRAVRAELGAPKPSIPALQTAVEGSIDEQSGLVNIIAGWSDPDYAARLANLFQQVVVERTNKQARARFEQQRKEIDAQLDSLGTSPSDVAARPSLVAQLIRLRFLAKNAEPATAVERAQASSSPVSPQPVRDTVIALLLGLTIGVLVAFLRDSLDRRLRDSGEIERELGFPVIGHVRNELMGKVVRGKAQGGSSDPDDLEGFRILRRNLDFLDVDSKTKLILVTSALPEEGKSTVAGSLAYASAASGSPTLLLECDLRRPSLGERMGIETAPGLTDHLASQSTFEDVSRVMPMSNGAGKKDPSGGAEGTVPGESLVVIPAGTPSPYPAELLHSSRMRGLLDAVAVHFETVIIDSSPLLPVADTLELLPLVDCVVLCVRSGQTTRDQARAAGAALARFPDRPTGLVITGLRKSEASAYGYYSYSYSARGIPAGA